MLFQCSPSALQLRSVAARVIVGCRSYSKDYASSSDDEKETKRPKPAKATVKDSKLAGPNEESAANRLSRLLASMQTDDQKFTQKVSMAKPGEGTKKLKEQVKENVAKQDIVAAAKRVAALLGNNVDKKTTESELLSKLLGHHLDDAAASKDKGAETVSSTGNETELSLSELIVGMKIDRSKPPEETETRADFVRRAITSRPHQSDAGERFRSFKMREERKREAESYTGSVNLFGSEPLGIFKQPAQLKHSPDMLATWAHLQQRDLQLQVAHPPNNYFEKCALWTEQGKLWRFPIDNEQNLCEEDGVNEDFSEHIFLEQHLEAWCPTRGPIRHFMELVCVGLSKNPYITAKDKKEHIMWYRDYFETKKDILKDLMSLEKIEKRDESKIQAAES